MKIFTGHRKTMAMLVITRWYLYEYIYICHISHISHIFRINFSMDDHWLRSSAGAIAEGLGWRGAWDPGDFAERRPSELGWDGWGMSSSPTTKCRVWWLIIAIWWVCHHFQTHRNSITLYSHLSNQHFLMVKLVKHLKPNIWWLVSRPTQRTGLGASQPLQPLLETQLTSFEARIQWDHQNSTVVHDG